VYMGKTGYGTTNAGGGGGGASRYSAGGGWEGADGGSGSVRIYG
jgi:hypothetical protein